MLNYIDSTYFIHMYKGVTQMGFQNMEVQSPQWHLFIFTKEYVIVSQFFEVHKKEIYLYWD